LLLEKLEAVRRPPSLEWTPSVGTKLWQEETKRPATELRQRRPADEEENFHFFNHLVARSLAEGVTFCKERVHFPFSICHLSFSILELWSIAVLQWKMTNGKWKMENVTFCHAQS
jgi:hypothetical protein